MVYGLNIQRYPEVVQGSTINRLNIRFGGGEIGKPGYGSQKSGGTKDP